MCAPRMGQADGMHQAAKHGTTADGKCMVKGMRVAGMAVGGVSGADAGVEVGWVIAVQACVGEK